MGARIEARKSSTPFWGYLAPGVSNTSLFQTPESRDMTWSLFPREAKLWSTFLKIYFPLGPSSSCFFPSQCPPNLYFVESPKCPRVHEYEVNLGSHGQAQFQVGGLISGICLLSDEISFKESHEIGPPEWWCLGDEEAFQKFT